MIDPDVIGQTGSTQKYPDIPNDQEDPTIFALNEAV